MDIGAISNILTKGKAVAYAKVVKGLGVGALATGRSKDTMR
jgi:hypothetical protein